MVQRAAGLFVPREQRVEAVSQGGVARAFAVEERRAFRGIGNGDGGDEEVELGNGRSPVMPSLA